MRTTILTILQCLGTFAALAGLYLLLGLAWALVAGGIGLVALATIAEALPPRPAPRPAPRRPRSPLED